MNYLKYAFYYIAADKREVRKVAEKLAHDWIVENMKDEPKLSNKRTLCYQGYIKGYMDAYCSRVAHERIESDKLAKQSK